MNVFSYRLRPTTAWATPLEADSLFGALCWEIVRRQGEADLLRVLDRFRKGDPPFVLSNAFPGDLLPRPLVLAGSKWVTRDGFAQVRAGECPPDVDAPEPQIDSQLHVERDTSVYDTFEMQGGPEYFTVYARVVPEWSETLRKLLQSLGMYGFGKRRGLGLGQFEVPEKPEPCPWLEPLPFESGFVSLSHFIPQESDPTKGRWSLQVKYPKLSAGHGSPNAFKGRLLQLEAGSCFQSPGRPRRWYGRMVGDKTLHYGLALAIGIKWPTDPV